MVYGKLPSIFLFILAFIAITISGFQCATRVMSRGEIPIIQRGDQQTIENRGYDDSYGDPDGNSYDDRYPDDYFQDERGDRYDGDERDDRNERNYEDRLPKEYEDSRCSRGQLRDLRYGAMANFEFDRSSLEDFLLGQSLNFDPVCARLYLDMSKMGSVYKGSLSLALQTSSNIKTFPGFSSGYSSSDNRYNKWSGASSWKGNREDKVKKQFHAIYEDEHSAIILRLEDIRIREVRDGEIEYIGAGEVYYKMFRIATGYDVNKSNTKGSCYSRGTYISQAHTAPPKRNRCWFTTIGPYNCRPNGSLNPKDKFTDINIRTSSYKCFSRLGRFWNLSIEEAFNDSVEDIN